MDDEKQNLSILELSMEIKSIKEKLAKMPTTDEVRLAIKEGIEEALKNCDGKYATKEQVGLLEKVVYGAVGAILLAFMGGVIFLVFK